MDERRTGSANRSWIVGKLETSRAVPVGLFELPRAKQKSSGNAAEVLRRGDHGGWSSTAEQYNLGRGLSQAIYLENKRTGFTRRSQHRRRTENALIGVQTKDV